MTQPFLITGLPRSRTAWFSVLTTTEASLCYHEPLFGMSHWTDVYKLWRAGDRAYTGVSDCCAGFHLKAILAEIAPRTLIVERPIREVEASLAREFPKTKRSNFCELLAEKLNGVPNSDLVKRVSFDMLRFPLVVESCWQWLLPDLPFDTLRAVQIMRANIQVDKGYMHRRVAEQKLGPETYLGEDVASRLKVL